MNIDVKCKKEYLKLQALHFEIGVEFRVSVHEAQAHPPARPERTRIPPPPGAQARPPSVALNPGDTCDGLKEYQREQ